MSEWSRCLTVVLDRMVDSFDRPDDDGVRDFWTRACHSSGNGMSGSVIHFSGWLRAVCWWRAGGTRQKAYSDEELEQEYRWCDKKYERLEISGVSGFPVIDQSKITVDLASVPITFGDRVVRGEGASYATAETILLAGCGGIKLLDGRESTRVAPCSSSWLLQDRPEPREGRRSQVNLPKLRAKKLAERTLCRKPEVILGNATEGAPASSISR